MPKCVTCNGAGVVDYLFEGKSLGWKCPACEGTGNGLDVTVPRGCDCCDHTHDSPDPVVQRLQNEVELLKGLLREAVEVAHYDDEWWGNDIPDTWFWRVVAAIEGKP